MRPENVTGKTEELVKRFDAAEEQIRRAESELNRARCELSNARIALGKWMVPEDAKPDEPFHLWYGDGLLQVVLSKQNDYEVKWRKRPTPRA